MNDLNVILCSKNRNEMLVLTLYSLFMNTNNFNTTVFIWLDSEEPKKWQSVVLNFLYSRGNFKIIIIDNKNWNHMSWIKKCLESVDNDNPILFVDDDAIILPNAIEKVYDEFGKYEKLWALEFMHPTSIENIYDLRQTRYNFWEPFNSGNVFRHDYLWENDVILNTDKIGWFFMVKSREVFDIKDFDEVPEFWNDFTMWNLIRDKGYKVCSKPDVGFIHFGVSESHYKDIYNILPPKTKIF